MIKVWKSEEKELYLGMRSIEGLDEHGPSIVAVDGSGVYVATLFNLSPSGGFVTNKYISERGLIESGYNTDTLLWDDGGNFEGIRPVKSIAKEEAEDMARMDNKEME